MGVVMRVGAEERAKSLAAFTSTPRDIFDPPFVNANRYAGS